MMRALLISLGLLAAAPAAASVGTITLNPGFTAWSHGSPRSGDARSGRETADHWISKWTVEGSRGLSARIPGGGLRYYMRAPPGRTSTFYTRQTIFGVDGFLGHRYRAVVVAEARTRGVLGGFYINARWNRLQRFNVIQTARSVHVKRSRQVYATTFTVPNRPQRWHKDRSQGLEFAWVMDVDGYAAAVDIYSIWLFKVR